MKKMISNQNNKINKQSKVTIVMPCFNEEHTIYEIIKRVLKEDCVGELIIVDDGSTDGTLRNIEKIRNKRVSVLKNKKNFGKGYSVRRGIEVAQFPIIGIQDADLEYSPKDYEKLIRPIIDMDADVVYGSRFRTIEATKLLYFSHYLANKFLTFLTNIFTNLNLSDMETCLKFFRTSAIRSVKLKENKFTIEPELTIKLALKKFIFYEVPITYVGRKYSEGKKIKFKDGILAIFCIFKYGIGLRIRGK
jgi:glycosyltransferase involved in cell wall biosynthesis